MGRKRLSLIPDQMRMISSTIHIITAKREREGSQEIYAIIKIKSEIPDLLATVSGKIKKGAYHHRTIEPWRRCQICPRRLHSFLNITKNCVNSITKILSALS